MNIYNGFINLKRGTKDTDFSDAVAACLDHLKDNGHITGWRLMRSKLGLGMPELGDFHLMIETQTMAELDDAFNLVAERTEPIESLHFAVNSKVASVRFSLYRDFPDPVRKRGEEKF